MFSTICKKNSTMHNELITQEKIHEIADIPLKEPSYYKAPNFYFYFIIITKKIMLPEDKTKILS